MGVIPSEIIKKLVWKYPRMPELQSRYPLIPDLVMIFNANTAAT